MWLEDQSQRNVPLNGLPRFRRRLRVCLMTYSVRKVEALKKEHSVQGWFVRFKERHCLPHFKMACTASSNKDTIPGSAEKHYRRR